MKIIIEGNKCIACDGEGFTGETVQMDAWLKTIRVWCEPCKGTGIVPYPYITKKE